MQGEGGDGADNNASWWELDPIEPGDFYEDCRYHPVLCVKADYSNSPEGDELEGISLVDGGIGSCSPRHCGPVKLTPEQAIERRIHWKEFEAIEIPKLVAEIEAFDRTRQLERSDAAGPADPG